MTDFQILLENIASYYGEGSDEWVEIAKYGLSGDNAASILKQTPYVNYTVSSSGKVLNYSIIKDIETGVSESLPSIIDSNLQTGTASLANTTQISIPANTVIDSTGKVIAESGTKAVSTGSKVATVAGKVATGVACVATGLQLGKVIDSALYNANPDFWDSHNMETLNPDTWGDIVTDDSLLGKAFHVFYGLDNNESQMYLDENAFAYIANYMQHQGVFSSSIKIDTDYDYPSNISNIDFNTMGIYLNTGFSYYSSLYGKRVYYSTKNNSDNVYLLAGIYNDTRKYQASIAFISKQPFTFNETYGSYSSDEGARLRKTSYGDFYSKTFETDISVISDLDIPITNILDKQGNVITDHYFASAMINYICPIVLYNSIIEGSLINGISNQTDAAIPTLSNDDTVEQTLQKLKEQLPFLWDNAIESEVIQDDGTTKKYKYVPVGFPDSDKKPTTGNQSQYKTKVGTSSDKKTQDKAVERMSKKKTDPNPPKKNIGSTPIPVIPNGEMDALFTVYNPNLTELKQFGSWLWSSNFFEQLKKLFSDPMQAIIGLHKIYVPTTNLSEKQTIRCGYIDSEVPSYVVANQYTTINCGKVSLLEYFGNVFDYEPYTSIKLYLPFIGIVKLDVSEVMRSTIEIAYHVDVLTGACLAEVKIIRDTTESVLYTFTGNMGVQYPLSSGSYIGIVGGLLGIAGGVVGSLATANPVPLAIGLSAASSSGKLHTDVAHSGNISSNCGAMGIKKPYLIINRPQTQLAEDFEKYQGYPSNYTTTLSNCNGFVQVLEVHVDDINTATSDEKQSIELLLKQGVIIE